ncbi:MAG: hypothetical protein MJ052_05050, partial [Sphaerochaetaceae bacterium]|nr:hypothetical protein [Sphaerochaetaceae bacterium]
DPDDNKKKDGDYIDRFSTRKMDDVFIFADDKDGTDGSTLAAAAEAGKLIIVSPSANLEKFINYVTSGEGERAPYSYIPYGYDLSELDTREFYLYFAMKKINEDEDIWDTYFSYSDFSLWDVVDGKPMDKEVKKSMIVDFQDEIDDYASFVKGEHATLSGSRDVKKALENELSATHIRYKMYHNNRKASTEKTEHNLFITSSSKTDKPLLAKYEWTYIRNGFQSKYTFHLTRETSNPNDVYGWRVSSSRDITLWVIHNVPKSEHLYVIKDQADYDFHSVFISNPVYFDENKPMIPIEQMICNDRGDWAYYGGGSSGSTVAKGLEWYGDSGWIETRVYFTDNVSRNNSYAFGNMTPVTTQTVVTKTDSINFGLKGGIGGEYSAQGGDLKGFKFNGHLEGSFGISHTTSENIPEVTVFYAGNTGDNDPVLRWRYAVRDDFRCSFSPARYAGSKYSHAPSNTSMSNLRPPASMYTISVADAYVNKVGLKFNSGFRLKRKAFKAGAEVCVGYTSAESEASCVLPYDKDPAHYGGKLPW